MRYTSILSFILSLLFTRKAVGTMADTMANYLFDQAELDQARSIWNAQGLRDYDFHYEKIGPDSQHAVYPWLVQVRNSVPSAYDGSGNQILWAVPPDVPDLFEMIQDLMDGNPRHVQVQYHTLGFPESIYIIQASGAVYDVRISDFHTGIPQQVVTTTTITNPNTNRPGNPNLPFQPRSESSTNLGDAQARWETGVLSGYAYTYNSYGHNPHHLAFPWSVFVNNGMDASGWDANNKVITTKNPHPYNMEELFQRIRKAYADGVKNIQVRYNQKYGFPEKIYIVYNEDVLHSTYDVEITDFRLL